MQEKQSMQQCSFFANDCAAFDRRGLCEAVIDIEYGPYRRCPFYKNIDQNCEEHLRAINRIVRLGRFDLLDKYHRRELFG